MGNCIKIPKLNVENDTNSKCCNDDDCASKCCNNIHESCPSSCCIIKIYKRTSKQDLQLT